MNLFALDTTLNRCSVALVAEGAARAWASEAMERGHAERIAPMAEEALRAAGLPFSALDRIVVTTGPGSFTGLRVGLAFARGLAVSLGKPCVGVSTLEALALEQGEAGLRGAAIAVGAELYVATFADGAPLTPPRRCTPDEARAALEGAKVRGPGAAAFGGAETDAPDILALARRAGGLDPARYRPDPLYLRAPHVTLPAGA